MPEQQNQAWLRAMPWVFVVVWSTGFIVARYGMPNSPPFTFLLWRYVFSVLCFVLWAKLARVPWPQGRAQWGHLAVTGVLMHAGYLGGVWAAVKVGMGAGLTALIVGLQPVITAIWLSARGGHVSRRQWQGHTELGCASSRHSKYLIHRALRTLGGIDQFFTAFKPNAIRTL